MTTRREVLEIAGSSPLADGLAWLRSYERWFRQRGDRQAARYWANGDQAYAALAAENYLDAAALRAAAHILAPCSFSPLLAKGT